MKEQDRPHHEVLGELIRDTRFCMLAHRHTDGRLHSHPLTTLDAELGADGRIYFFVSRRTELGQRLRSDGNVNLAYAHPGKDRYVSVTGTARVLEDAQKKRELYSPMVKAWFPDGPEDPELELIEVQIEEAEYWNVEESKLVQLFKMARSAVTGHKPHDLGEHREVQFR